jgi:hypothetical protein
VRILLRSSARPVRTAESIFLKAGFVARKQGRTPGFDRHGISGLGAVARLHVINWPGKGLGSVSRIRRDELGWRVWLRAA